MGVKLPHQKPRNLLASLFYRLKFLPVSNQRRLRLFLDLEWIFDRLAQETSYELFGEEHPAREESVEHILGLIRPEHRVLDLGCSRGEITRKLADIARFTVGVDRQSDAIEYAKRFENDRLRFVQADAREYLASDASEYDVLILSHILGYFDDPVAFLRSLVTRFRFVYVETPDFDKTIFNRIRQSLGLDLLYTDCGYAAEYDRDEMNDLLRDSGLTVISADHRFGNQRYWCEVNGPAI